MGIEAFNYISNLNASYPQADDARSEGDDHIRGIKTVLKTTFPNLAGAMTKTHTQLNATPHDEATLKQMLGWSPVKVTNNNSQLKADAVIEFGWHVATKRLRPRVDGTAPDGGIGGLVLDSEFTGAINQQKQSNPGYQVFPGGFCICFGRFAANTAANTPQYFSVNLPKPINVQSAMVFPSSGISLGGTYGTVEGYGLGFMDGYLYSESAAQRNWSWIAFGFL